MRAAYADPPYPGQAKRHYANHPDYGGEVDHGELIARLTDDYEAWALSTSTPALRALLPLCPPNVRVGAWVKPWAVYKPGIRVPYAWEPVLYVSPQREGDRRPRADGDWHASNAVMSSGAGVQTKGQKSREFCAWLFTLLGLVPDDDFEDLFPGSRSVSQAWEWWRAQTRIVPERPADLRKRYPQLALGSVV